MRGEEAFEERIWRVGGLSAVVEVPFGTDPSGRTGSVGFPAGSGEGAIRVPDSERPYPYILRLRRPTAFLFFGRRLESP